MTLITTHINADFDAIASVVAAKKLYPQGIVVLPGSMEKKVREFLQTFSILQDVKRIKDIDREKIREVIVVDTSSSERLGELKEFLPGRKVVVYDHHKEGDIKEVAGAETELITASVGATATLFVDILKKKDIPITPLEATLLALGIYEETGSLLFPSTTERDLLAVAYLLKRGANLNIISTFLRSFINKEELSLLNDFLEDSKDLLQDGIRIKICKAKREEYPGEIAHLAHRIMEMEDIDGLILLLDVAGRIIIIARSSVPELDVGQLMERFGGGGHPSAASATLKDRGIEEIEIEIVEALKEILRPRRLARHLMTARVVTIGPDATIKEAEIEMTKYGVNVLPVVKDGRLLGIISRETVEKALFHGFKLHRVMEFATIDPEVVTPDTPLEEVERIMVEQNQRFMPVINEEGLLVGVITRTDLLRAMYEGLMRMRAQESEPGGASLRTRNLSGQLREHFPEETYQLLRMAGEVADSLGYNAYLVGGSVRDLLRGERNLDIDIVVEGDGIIFARSLQERIEKNGVSTKLRTHERFGTAKLIIEERIIDIATARTEYYEGPASLPKVESSSIKKDLYRRDFTINTLAIRLNPSEFGILVDFFGAQKDLKEKIIRVLHSVSFVEDPTRALRAIRFSERFGFRISKQTENLMRVAAKMNLFEKLSSERLYEELGLLLIEVPPLKVLERLSEYDLLKVISPSLKPDKELRERLRSLEEILAWFDLSEIKGEIKREKLIMEVFLFGLDRNSLERAIKRLSPNRRYEEGLREDIESVKRILPEIKRLASLEGTNAFDPVELYALLEGLSLEAILLAMAVCEPHPTVRGTQGETSFLPVRPPTVTSPPGTVTSPLSKVRRLFVRYLTELRDVRPLLRGRDLQNMGIPPGPEYSRIFREILYEKLRGRLKTVEEEREFVKRLKLG